MAFNIKQIQGIARALHLYKELYVTSLGQCFIEEKDAIESVRIKNTIIDEPDDYVSLRKMNVTDASVEKLSAYVKDTKLFDTMFKSEAKVPKFRDRKEDLLPKRPEVKTLSEEEEDEIAKALGLPTKAEERERKERIEKQRIADEAYRKARKEEEERILREEAEAKAREDAKKAKEQEALEKIKNK